MWKRSGRTRGGREAGHLDIADLGCGSERLRGVIEEHLDQRFTYQGYDLQPQVPGTIGMDLGCELPPREFDLVFALGLLEYLPDVGWFLAGLARTASFAVVSYVVADAPDDLSEDDRRRRGWINHYSREDVVTLFDRAGFAVLESLVIEEGRTGLWLLESRNRSRAQ
jgi:hypothetical protein